jgi:hypothetical protein
MSLREDGNGSAIRQEDLAYFLPRGIAMVMSRKSFDSRDRTSTYKRWDMKISRFSVCAAVLGWLWASGILAAQDKPKDKSKETVQESVTVTAVEVPVRVYDGKGFVPGLTKADFEVYEDGVKQAITGFEAVSRSIAPAAIDLPGQIKRPPGTRNFVLIFNVFDYSDEVGEAIDFFFKDIYNAGDRLFAVMEAKVYQIKPEAGEDVKSKLKELLLKIKKNNRIEITRSFLTLERKAESLLGTLDGTGAGEYETGEPDAVESIRRFFDDYGRVWIAFRDQNPVPGKELYKYLADKIKPLDGEKWAICFQQRAMFPKLKSGSRLIRAFDQAGLDDNLDARAAMVRSQLTRLELSFNANAGFPGDKIREILAEANITFHVLLMKPISLQAVHDEEMMELGDIRAEYEDVLKSVSRETGGLIAFSNKVIETLKEASVKQDQFYLLVYQPKREGKEKTRKIDVRVLRPDVDVFSLKEYSRKKAPGITIYDFEARGKTLAFRVRNYAVAPLGGKRQGRATIKVALFDDRSNKAYGKESAFDLVAETIGISLDLSKLVPGTYFALIEAYDLVNGEKAVFSSAVALE